MLYPTIQELTKNKQSRYSLVLAVAKRARKIASEAEQQGIMLNEKPVKTAVNEIAQGKVIFRDK